MSIIKYLLIFFGLFVYVGYGATINRIQKGTVILGAGTGSVTQAITAVDLSKSFLVFSLSLNSDRPGENQIAGRITSSTLLTFDRFEIGGTPAAEIYWEVFEFSSGVSVQRGSLTNLASGGVNVTISAVTTSEAFATVNIRKDGGQYGSDDFVTADITSSTNLYIDRDAGGANPQNVYWQVINWTGASVQKISATLSDGSDSLAVTLGSTVDKSKTMILGSYRCDGDVDAADFACAELVNDNTVSFSRVDDNRDLNIVYYVIEFSDNTDVIHGAIRMTAIQDDITTPICSVTEATAGIIPPNNFFRNGSNCEDSDDDMAIAFANITLSSSSSVNAKRSGTGFAALFPFQVIEFSAAAPSGCIPPEPGASTPRTFELCGVSLPIELTNFAVQLEANKEIQLLWTTASELNNDYFVLERSGDGINFEYMGKVNGVGNSVSTLNYNFFDRNPLPGISYYRIKQVDFDGGYSYSDALSIRNNDEGFILYPNPTIGKVYFSVKVINGEQIELFNSIGEQIHITTFNHFEQVGIDLSDLPNGIYFVHYNGVVKKVQKH